MIKNIEQKILNITLKFIFVHLNLLCDLWNIFSINSLKHRLKKKIVFRSSTTALKYSKDLKVHRHIYPSRRHYIIQKKCFK